MSKFIDGLKGFAKGFGNSAYNFGIGLPNAFGSSLVPGIASGLTNMIFGETLADKQRYALEQMEQQNKYNVQNYEMMRDDQLKYSDPAFIRSRLEKAGLSASLALGNGGMSSPISASVGGSSTPGGISSSLRSGQMVNIAESLARIRNLDADTEGKKTETDYNQKAMQTRLDILSQEKLSKMYANNIARIDALYKEDITQATLDKLTKEIDAITFDMANRKELTDIERQKLNAYLESLTHQYSLWKSQIDLNEAKVDTEGTQQLLNRAKASLSSASQSEINERMQNYSKQRDKIDAEIERIGKENSLTDQHIREIKNNIALRWATFGVQTAKDISSEIRNWINPLSSIKDLRKENRSLQDMLDDKDIFFAD